MSTRAVGPFRGTESADRGHGCSSGGYGMPGAEWSADLSSTGSISSMPGLASSWSARGSNRLLRNQATALLSPEDLIDHIGAGPWQLDVVAANKTGVLAALGDGASLEELVSTLNRPAARLMPELVSLELSRGVVCESGFRWKPA